MNQLDLFTWNKHWAYFNTTSKKGEELEKARVKASGQAWEILEIFRKHPNASMTPWEVQLHVRHMMITSIRRSITTLTDAGYLVKTGERRKSGPANETSYTWKLKQTI